MKSILMPIIAASVVLSNAAFAAPPADAPAGSTGVCKDGSYYSGAEKKGACRGHKGVKDWWGDASTAGKSADKAGTKADAKGESKADAKGSTAPGAAAGTGASSGATAAKTDAPSKMATPSKTDAMKPATAAAPGGGPGMVWVNDTSKVYHCPGDRWYGKTKKGEYMSEADAKSKGYKADHDKACK